MTAPAPNVTNSSTAAEPVRDDRRAAAATGDGDHRAAVLEVRSASKTYRRGEDRVEALRAVSLSVRAGEFVAVMGASGSGKSTLMHLCGGLDTPTAGQIFVDGSDLSAMGDRERTLFRRRRMGVVFQQFNLLPTLTAVENVALPLLIDGREDAAVYARAEALLEQVHLSNRRTHRPDAMSGGEQQRVAIARALVNDPAIVLADEPTGNLDSRNAHEIWSVLRRLVSEHGRTVLMITHEPSGAAFADRVLVLRDGQRVGEFATGASNNNHNGSHTSGDAAMVAARYAELAA